MEWQIIVNTLVVAETDAQLGPLKVTLGNETLKAPRTISVAFTNTGVHAAKPDDIAIPPEVTVENGSIVSAVVEERTQGSNRPITQPLAAVFPTTTIEAKRTLLNPGDAVLFQMLVDGVDATVTAEFKATDFRFTRKELDNSGLEAEVNRLKWLLTIAVLGGVVILVALIISSYGDLLHAQ